MLFYIPLFILKLVFHVIHKLHTERLEYTKSKYHSHLTKYILDLFIYPALLKYNWNITLNKFKMCDLLV